MIVERAGRVRINVEQQPPPRGSLAEQDVLNAQKSGTTKADQLRQLDQQIAEVTERINYYNTLLETDYPWGDSASNNRTNRDGYRSSLRLLQAQKAALLAPPNVSSPSEKRVQSGNPYKKKKRK